jgi:hypothetical protein
LHLTAADPARPNVEKHSTVSTQAAAGIIFSQLQQVHQSITIVPPVVRVRFAGTIYSGNPEPLEEKMEKMDAETATRTSSISHRSSSLLIGERRRSFVEEDNRITSFTYDSWSIKKLLGRHGSQKYRVLERERREPRRLKKKSFTERMY